MIKTLSFVVLGVVVLLLLVVLVVSLKKKKRMFNAFCVRDQYVEELVSYFFPMDYQIFLVELRKKPRRKFPNFYREYMNQFEKLLSEKAEKYFSEMDKAFIKSYFNSRYV